MYNSPVNLTEVLNRTPDRKRLLCRLRLCFPRKQVFSGYAVFANEAKQNHETEMVAGLYHVVECPHCGAHRVGVSAWRVLNDA